MKQRIYSDYAATTPARPEVVAAMLRYLGENDFNPSSLHAEGRQARAAVDEGRERLAQALGVDAREIVLTSGGSEADNLAVLGGARARRNDGRHVVSVATEHRAVLHAFEVLRDEGFDVALLGVDRDGAVDPDTFARALTPQTVLASVMLGNNEIGTIQPIAELAALARERGVTFHTDAVAAAGRISVDPASLGVDLLSLSAHKFYGPKGAGLLFVRAGTPLVPILVGGGQEHGRRAGTENVAGITGMAVALELASGELAAEGARLAELGKRFERGVRGGIPGTRINAAGATRLPGICSIAVEGTDAQSLLVRLDLEGVAASNGSACASGTTDPSHVVAALGVPDWVGCATLRFSFGRLTTPQDVDTLLRLLPPAVAAVREMEPILGMS